MARYTNREPRKVGDRLRDAAHACRDTAEDHYRVRDNGYGAIAFRVDGNDLSGESNFHAATAMLESCGKDYVAAHEGSTWQYGNLATILFPLTGAWLETAADILDSLESYPILDETDYCQREWDTMREAIDEDYVPAWVEDDDVRALLVDKLARRAYDECSASRIEDVPHDGREELFARWTAEILGADPYRADTLDRELAHLGIPVEEDGELPYVDWSEARRLSERLGVQVLQTFTAGHVEGDRTEEATVWVRVHWADIR